MDIDHKELISVIIPFYNQEHYFEECLNSVIHQTYSNFEIIIINDGSDKKYDKILTELQLKHLDKIKIFGQENKGVSAARNLGILKSKGEYVAFIDSDDVWLPNKLEYQINLIKKKKIDFIHGSYLIINENDSFVGKFIAKSLDYNDLIKSCDVGLSTVLIKSNLIKKHLFKNISTKEDYVCWLSVIKEINLLYGDSKEVAFYRERKKSLSSNIITKFINAFKVYNKYENKNIITSIFRTLILSFSWILKTYFIIFKNPDIKNFKYLSSIKNLKFDESFILSALNMASLSNIKLFYLNNEKFIFWIDGYCARFIINIFNKIPGRKIITDFKITENIKKVYLIGKKSELQLNYLKNKFKYEINFIELPYFQELSEIRKIKLNIDDNSLVILNISTPKQEILALNILNCNLGKKIFIFCLGGGMSMVSGEEKIVPESIEKMNLEWLWRLRTNTWFRFKRLVSTAFGFFLKLLFNYFKKTKFKNLN